MIDITLFDADQADAALRQEVTLADLEFDYAWDSAIPKCTKCAKVRYQAYQSHFFEHWQVCKRHQVCMERQHQSHLPPAEEPVSEFADVFDTSTHYAVHTDENHSWKTCRDITHIHCAEYQADAARSEEHAIHQPRHFISPAVKKLQFELLGRVRASLEGKGTPCGAL
jgi:hypothetical protein